MYVFKCTVLASGMGMRHVVDCGPFSLEITECKMEGMAQPPEQIKSSSTRRVENEIQDRFGKIKYRIFRLRLSSLTGRRERYGYCYKRQTGVQAVCMTVPTPYRWIIMLISLYRVLIL